MAGLYIALYRLSEALSGNEAFGGVASLFFLPAFVRLIGFMVIGWAIAPALFVAALFCVDLGLGLEGRVVVSAGLAVGAPLGMWLVSKVVALDAHLFGLNALQLLWLSIGSALGNALFYKMGVVLVRGDAMDPAIWASILAGDILGTWGVMIVGKWLLTSFGRFGVK